MLEAFGQDIWLVPGDDVISFGFRYPTRMAVIRLTDGGLFLWSPVALTPGRAEAVRALGEVRHLVAPNRLHHLFLGDWARAFPEARVAGVAGLAPRRPDIAFDDLLDDTAPPGWAGEIDQVLMRGSAITEEAVFFHRASGTVLITDLVQHFPQGWFAGMQAIIARLDLMAAPEPEVPRKFRLSFYDRNAARRGLRQILGWPVENLVMAHGAPVIGTGQQSLAHAFRWLAR